MFGWVRGKEATDYNTLVQVIRAELSPIRTDLNNLRASVEEVRQAQRQMYSQREIDRMFDERDKAIKTVGEQAESTSKALGALWQQTAIKVGVALALVGQVIELWRSVH